MEDDNNTASKLMNDEIKEIKIGMYSTGEILEFMTNGEGRAFMGRSMYDAILDYITNLQHTEDLYNQLLKDYDELQQENERLKVKYNEEKSHQINYNYFETLYSKSTKEIVIDDLVWKCEELDNFKKNYEKLYIEKEDYKSRCEKAVEYLKNNCYIGDCINTYEAIDITNVMNILNGRSDE